MIYWILFWCLVVTFLLSLIITPLMSKYPSDGFKETWKKVMIGFAFIWILIIISLIIIIGLFFYFFN